MGSGDGIPEDGRNRAPECSGLYVDLENLHADAQALVKRLIENWPDKVPALSRLALYVRADQVELWRLWATSRFPCLEVVVSGTQHFSMSATKNSADIAVATHAMADLALRRVSHVVVFSDDSDFISLYAAIRDEPEIPLPEGKVPFLWVITDREGSGIRYGQAVLPPGAAAPGRSRRAGPGCDVRKYRFCGCQGGTARGARDRRNAGGDGPCRGGAYRGGAVQEHRLPENYQGTLA